MPFLCALTSLLEFVLFTALTAILFSVAAISLLMEIIITNFVQPMTAVLLRQSGRMAIVVLADLGTKFPCFQYIFQPEYATFINTAGTVLLGWLIISWISYLVWVLFAPLTVALIAIVLISPMTTEWCFKQTVPGLEVVFNGFSEKFRSILMRVRG